ncbi:MAG: hypothetical protein HY741_00670 [Chloroflexi bacterium]|nr:hypothetical protein [Chloroflexota bacterium]
MSTNTLQVVERLLDRLTTEEQVILIEQLAMRLRNSVRSHPPRDLYGIWRGRFPDEFDFEQEIHQLRHAYDDAPSDS